MIVLSLVFGDQPVPFKPHISQGLVCTPTVPGRNTLGNNWLPVMQSLTLCTKSPRAVGEKVFSENDCDSYKKSEREQQKGVLGATVLDRGFPGGSDGKESACNAGDRVRSLNWEDPLEKGLATHSSILVWRIPWTEGPSRLQSSMGSERIRHNWMTDHTHILDRSE